MALKGLVITRLAALRCSRCRGPHVRYLLGSGELLCLPCWCSLEVRPASVAAPDPPPPQTPPR